MTEYEVQRRLSLLLIAAVVAVAACGGTGVGRQDGLDASSNNNTNNSNDAGVCGDGRREAPTEDCDGNDLGGATCTSLGYTAGMLGCSAACRFDVAACTTCGDGVREGDEACDGSDLAGATCLSLGLPDGQLACDADCQIDSATCGVCGDGICSSGGSEDATACPADCVWDDLIVRAGGHNCGIRAGVLYCWGLNSRGELGDGSRTDSPWPISVAMPGAVVDAAVFGSNTCALTGSGDLYCWGDNLYGETGVDPAVHPVFQPTRVDLPDPVQTAAIGIDSTCAVLSDGAVWCWGRADYGLLGDGNLAPNRHQPAPTIGLTQIDEIRAGTHVCGWRQGGSAWCWGLNARGQLRDGTTTRSATPILVPGIGAVRELAVAANSTCVLEGAGTVTCWGFGEFGGLGHGSFTNSPDPVAVVGLPSNIASIRAGGFHLCALDNLGDVYCWGRNEFGQLGDGTQQDRATAGPLPGLPPVAKIGLGYYHTCVLSVSGEIYCLGENSKGQLGNGTTTNSLIPVKVIEP